MTTINFNDPPAEAPPGADRLLYPLARQVCIDHQPARDDSCRTCGRAWPCEPRRAGESGLRIALYVGPVPTTEWPYMPGQRVPTNPRHNGPGGRPDQFEDNPDPGSP